jgi:hypothetical protein
MRRLTKAFALAAFAVAIPAAAQETALPITIAPGETITARIIEDPPAFELVARDTAAPRLDPEAPPPPENIVRFTFATLEGHGPVLQVQSSYDRHFNYRARMFLGERSAPTSVCIVMPRIPGFEMWPHPIDRLELSQPHFIQVAEGEISCQ